MAEPKIQILITAKDDASKTLQSLQGRIQGMSKQLKIAGVAMMAIGAGIAASLTMALKAAAEEEKGIVRLSIAMRNMGISYDEVKGSLEAWIDTQQQKTAVADSEQRDALSQLIRMTGNLAEAQDKMTLSMDIAAGTGRDLASANQMVMYAMGGNWGMVERYIPALKEAQTEEEKWIKLREMFVGQAEAYGQTLDGQFKLLMHNIGDLKEAIGTVLTPAVQNIINRLNEFVMWLKELNPEIIKWSTIALVATSALFLLGGAILLLLGFLPSLITGLGTVIGLMHGTTVAAGGMAVSVGGAATAFGVGTVAVYGFMTALIALLPYIALITAGLAMIAYGIFYIHQQSAQYEKDLERSHELLKIWNNYQKGAQLSLEELNRLLEAGWIDLQRYNQAMERTTAIQGELQMQTESLTTVTGGLTVANIALGNSYNYVAMSQERWLQMAPRIAQQAGYVEAYYKSMYPPEMWAAYEKIFGKGTAGVISIWEPELGISAELAKITKDFFAKGGHKAGLAAIEAYLAAWEEAGYETGETWEKLRREAEEEDGVKEEEPPDIPRGVTEFHYAGIVPGRRGQRVPIIAEGGEMFLGASGGGIHIINDIVIYLDGEEMNRTIIDKVSEKVRVRGGL